MSKVVSKNLKAKKDWKAWTAEDVVTKMGVLVPEHKRREALEYIHAWLDSVKDDAKEQNDMTPEEYIVESFKAAYSNGDMCTIVNADPEDLTPIDNAEGEEDEDQVIIEVSQTEVKKALKALLTKQNDIMTTLYSKHEEYNNEYFYGRLEVPLITIDKLSNKTLANYTHGVDSTGLDNHIRFNKNFIALNTETRILETLRHEMIHQYQDQVLYKKTDKNGKLLHDGEKRPKDWHNKDFKEWAEKVDLVANGRNCTGNPAKMPEAKSYNRKFSCKCVATNGYPLTVWSTREIFAICRVCGAPFTEVKKAGALIAVSQSDIEKQGEDAIESKMIQVYNTFLRFEDKQELTDMVKELKRTDTEYKEGIYQKGHNAYAEGFHYWLAYNDPEVEVQKKLAEKLAEEEARLDRELKERLAREAEEARLLKAAEEARLAEEAKLAAEAEADRLKSLVPTELFKFDLKAMAEELAKKASEVPAEQEQPKKRRGRPAGSKNKKSNSEGEESNDKGNAIKEA